MKIESTFIGYLYYNHHYKCLQDTRNHQCNASRILSHDYLKLDDIMKMLNVS